MYVLMCRIDAPRSRVDVRLWVDPSVESTIETRRAVYRGALEQMAGVVCIKAGLRPCEAFRWVRSPHSTPAEALAWAEAEVQRAANEQLRN